MAHLCGLVHDIGKVGLPAGLLEKPGALTLEERRRMEEHSAIGERILAKVDDYAEIARIVRHHHERVDGNGYPDRVRGEEIPLLSRIIAVADAYNAMTSGRPYRDAMPSRVARFRLAQATGTQFDTTVVAAFEAILAGASETYLSGIRPDFTIEAQRQPRPASPASRPASPEYLIFEELLSSQNRLNAISDTKLLKNVANVDFCSGSRDVETPCDFVVREALRQKS